MPIIQVRVKPGSRVSELEVVPDGPWIARIKAPPVDGKANRELIELISEHFDCAKSAVSIKSGAGARVKWVEVSV